MELPPRNPLPVGESVPVLDELCMRAAVRVGSPVALVSLVDQLGQNLPGACGLSEPWRTERWTPLSHSFCQHVVTSGEPFVVPNANDEPLVAKNLAVMELGVIAYAGVPLVLEQGGAVTGALCAIDHRPRDWSPEQIEELRRLSVEVTRELGRLVPVGGQDRSGS